MKITPQTELSAFTTQTSKPQTPTHAEPVNAEQPEISGAAQILSENFSKLQNSLSPRTEMIQRHSSDLADPVSLTDRTIDRIIQSMQNS